ALSTLNPSASEAPEPPQSSGTQDSGRPASVSACHSGAFHSPLVSRLMVWASARSAKIFSAVSATMLSLSATAFPEIDWHRPGACCQGLRCDLFLRFMIGKSHSCDKRCPQGGMRQWHEDRQAKNKFRIVERSRICTHFAARYGKPAIHGRFETQLKSNKRKCGCRRVVWGGE